MFSWQPVAERRFLKIDVDSKWVSTSFWLVSALLPRAARRLLLIRLIQQDPIYSVFACRARRFPRRCVNFRRISLLKKRVNSIWRRVVGPMVSFARVADTSGPTNWSAGNVVNVQAVGTKSR
jgi:hypothetical protein